MSRDSWGSACSPRAGLFLAVGMLGGYTTFSYETLVLISKGSYAPALLYYSGQVALGLAAVYVGLFPSIGGEQRPMA